MAPNDVDFADVREQILRLLRRHEHDLSAESKDAVEHFVGHDEYEIAFEGLCLDLIEGRLMTAEDIADCVVLGETLGLDEETVLRDDFWTLLTAQRRLVEDRPGEDI